MRVQVAGSSPLKVMREALVDSLDAVPLLVAGLLLLIVASRKITLLDGLAWTEAAIFVAEAGVGSLAVLRPRSWWAVLAFGILSLVLLVGSASGWGDEGGCSCLGAGTSEQSRWSVAVGLALMAMLALAARVWSSRGNR